MDQYQMIISVDLYIGQALVMGNIRLRWENQIGCFIQPAV